MTKRLTRSKYLKLRNSLCEDLVEKSSETICKKFLNSDLYKSSDLILTYVSIGKEVSTLPILKQSISDGKKLAVPFCYDDIMEFRILSSLNELVTGKFGIPTSDDKMSVELSKYVKPVCIVPALSVDLNYNRLGYGGGYYDRFLSQHKDITSVALCFDCCISSCLPIDSYDEPIDYYISESHDIGGASVVR